MRLVLLTPEQIAENWHSIRDEIESCCERSGGKYEPSDILTAGLTGQMNLWLAVDDSGKHHALGITEIIQYPRIRVCAFLACTGEDSPEWVHLMADLERWAREKGCAVLEPRCRAGWERVLKPLGFKKSHVTLEKTL